MEKVIDLFKAFRNREIEYEELFGALTQMLSEDPNFSSQAVQSLDSAQQLTPIPVTDFIQLRAQLENTAETFHQQKVTAGPEEAEATKIFSAADPTMLPDSNLSSSDPTLMGTAPSDNAQPEPPAQTETKANTAPPADEATVIMPMPPRVPVAEPSPPPQESPIPGANDQATMIAPAVEPTPAPAEPEPTSEPTTPPTKPTKPAGFPPAVVYGGSAAGIIVLVLLVALLWPDSETTDDALETSGSTTQEPSPWGEPVPEPATDTTESTTTDSFEESEDHSTDTEAFVAEETESEISPIASDSDIDEDRDTDFETQTETQIDDQTETGQVETLAVDAEPEIVKDEAFYFKQIEDAVASDNLGPANQSATATFYLVELIKLNQDSDLVSDARALIAKRHLELAKSAREESRWKAAQEHLDAAFKVRLPDSYLP